MNQDDQVCQTTDAPSSGRFSRLRIRRKKPGAAPGTLTHEGEIRAEKFTIEATDYSADDLVRTVEERVKECVSFRDRPNPTWIHVTGLHEVEEIAKLCESFSVPMLLIEDILNSSSRSKIEVTDDSIFLQLKSLNRDSENGGVSVQQVSIYMSETTLLSFSEAPTTIFRPVHQRLDEPGRRIRQRGLDYLLWALLDTIVDHSLDALHAREAVLFQTNDLLLGNVDAVSPAELFRWKHEFNTLLRLVRPNREIVNALRHEMTTLVQVETHPFLNDLQDHCHILIEDCEFLREQAGGMREYLLTELNDRLNDTMKVLTALSVIFLPLSFLAGVYGMNFLWIPELEFKWSYPFLWLIFITMGGGIYWYFKKRKWI